MADTADRLKIVVISAIIICLILPHSSAQRDNSVEYSWTFDVNPDLSVDVSAIVTIHPSGTWSSRVVSFTTSYGVTNFAAYDYSTGTPLQVSQTAWTGGGTTYSFNFPQSEGDGYRYRIQFHSTGIISKTSGGFVVGYGWGGGNTVFQKVRLQLPVGYNIVSVVNTNSSSNIPYDESRNGTRVIADFHGTALPNGHFDWRVTASTFPDIEDAQFTMLSSLAILALPFVGIMGLIVFVRRMRSRRSGAAAELGVASKSPLTPAATAEGTEFCIASGVRIPATEHRLVDSPQVCRACGQPMRLLDEAQQKWYCYRDDEIWFGNEQRWHERRVPVDKKPDIMSDESILSEASKSWTEGRHAETFLLLMKAVTVDPNRANIWYEKARYECVDGLLEEALRSLKKACELDGTYILLADKFDSDFKALRTDPRFREIANKRDDQLEK